MELNATTTATATATAAAAAAATVTTTAAATPSTNTNNNIKNLLFYILFITTTTITTCRYKTSVEQSKEKVKKIEMKWLYVAFHTNVVISRRHLQSNVTLKYLNLLIILKGSLL